MNYMKRHQDLMRPVAGIIFMMVAFILFSSTNLFSKTLVNSNGKYLIVYNIKDDYFPEGPPSIGNLEIGMTKQKIESFGKESPIFTNQSLVCEKEDNTISEIKEECRAEFITPFSTVRSEVTFRFDESGKVISLYMDIGEDKNLYQSILRAVKNRYGSPAKISDDIVEKTCDHKSGVKIKSNDGFRFNTWHKKGDSGFISFGAIEYYSIACSYSGILELTSVSESYGLSLDLLTVVSVEASEEEKAEFVEHLF